MQHTFGYESKNYRWILENIQRDFKDIDIMELRKDGLTGVIRAVATGEIKVKVEPHDCD